MTHFGLLNLNKPTGQSSRRVVDVVQRLVRPAKAGHAGTLDPLASGVLVVCVGQATRLIGHVQRMPKRYRATFELGRESDTEDIEGQVRELENPLRPTFEEVQAAAAQFVGEIQQRPPAYSALKVAGRRAYDLARKGKDVQLKPRPVVIHGLEILEYRYPTLRLDLRCSSGTYVRSLGRDLAESLGAAAVMSALQRTAIGAFRVEEAVDPQSLSRENLAEFLLPARQAVGDMPTIRLTPQQAQPLSTGGALQLDRADAVPELAALDSEGQLLAVLQRRPDGTWRPSPNFASSAARR